MPAGGGPVGSLPSLYLPNGSASTLSDQLDRDVGGAHTMSQRPNRNEIRAGQGERPGGVDGHAARGFDLDRWAQPPSHSGPLGDGRWSLVVDQQPIGP